MTPKLSSTAFAMGHGGHHRCRGDAIWPADTTTSSH